MTRQNTSWKKQVRRILAIFGAGIILLQVGTSTAQAIDLNYLLNNDRLYYDPDYMGDCVTSNGLTLQGNDNAERVFNFFVTTPFSTNGDKPLNAVQAAAFVGNFMQETGESSAGANDAPSPTVVNSIGATGIAQWLGGRKDQLFTLATRQGLQPTDLEAQLAFVKQEIEGVESAAVVDSTFQAGTDIEAITVVIRKKYERPGEHEAEDGKRIQNAKDVYEKYKSAAGANPGSSAAAAGDSGCKSAEANTGNLIKTALSLAHEAPVEEGRAYKTDATDTYVEAIAQYGNIRGDNDGIMPYSDCGRFVSTVMRMSGIDKDYPLVSVDGAQRPYVMKHPEKYIVIDNPSMSNLQPGDIMISDTHTAIYLGNGEYDTVDASLTQRVPGVSNNMSSYLTTQQDVIIVRVKG